MEKILCIRRIQKQKTTKGGELMKVFLTIEKEKGDSGKDIEHIVGHCMVLIEVLETIGVPNQFKVTSLPRRKGEWIKASELDNIES